MAAGQTAPPCCPWKNLKTSETVTKGLKETPIWPLLTERKDTIPLFTRASDVQCTPQDLKTSRGLHEEMKKAASSNVKQVIDWVLEKTSKN